MHPKSTKKLPNDQGNFLGSAQNNLCFGGGLPLVLNIGQLWTRWKSIHVVVCSKEALQEGRKEDKEVLREIALFLLGIGGWGGKLQIVLDTV